MFHQICLEDVLYVLNLLHRLPTFVCIISSCFQDECQCHFQLNLYVLNIKLALTLYTYLKVCYGYQLLILLLFLIVSV